MAQSTEELLEEKNQMEISGIIATLKTLKDHYNSFYANKVENINNFLKTCKLSKFIEEETLNLNISAILKKCHQFTVILPNSFVSGFFCLMLCLEDLSMLPIGISYIFTAV